MKMKFPMLLSLLLTPQLVLAQSAQTAKQNEAQVENLVQKILSPYKKANTFSGTFQSSLVGIYQNQNRPISNEQMQTNYRLDSAGNRIREVIYFSSKHINRFSVPRKILSQTLKLVDDGKTQTQVDLEAKIYARTRRNHEVGPVAFLSPTLNQVARAIRSDGSSISSRSVGKFTVIDSKGDKWFDKFHAVIDSKTGALQTLDFSSMSWRIAIGASNQVFNVPVSESQFQWKPISNFKQIAESQLTHTMQGWKYNSRPTRGWKYANTRSSRVMLN